MMRQRRRATIEAAPAPEPLDLEPSGPPALGPIPWGYGENRVTAMARGPYWIFVYWELTDDAIARARAEVGASDAEWLNWATATGCTRAALEMSWLTLNATSPPARAGLVKRTGRVAGIAAFLARARDKELQRIRL